MSASPAAARPARSVFALDTTLLDLVWAVSEVTEDEAEVVATVLHLLESGRVRLTGSFRGSPLSELRR